MKRGRVANPENALLTGSRVYGTPTEESDVDMVVLMEPSEAIDLALAIGMEVSRAGPNHYPGLQFKVGRLNLIVETDPGWFGVWVVGTAELVKQKPVKREAAVEFFKHLREDLAARRLAAALARDGDVSAEHYEVQF